MNDKHAPRFGPGKTFLWKDNPRVTKSKAKLNTPDPMLLKLKLTDTTGKVWPSAKFQKHATMNWADPKMIKDLNKWRSQFLSRTLDKNSGRPKSSRPRWSSSEMYYMARLIQKAIWRKKASLSKSDWMVIAKRMNERFEGTIAKKGEQVPDTMNARRILVEGDVLRKDHRIPKRSYNTMKNQSGRWPCVQQMIEEELAKACDSSEEDMFASIGKGKGTSKGFEGNSKVSELFGLDDLDGTVETSSLDSGSEDDEDDAHTQVNDEENMDANNLEETTLYEFGSRFAAEGSSFM